MPGSPEVPVHRLVNEEEVKMLGVSAADPDNIYDQFIVGFARDRVKTGRAALSYYRRAIDKNQIYCAAMIANFVCQSENGFLEEGELSLRSWEDRRDMAMQMSHEVKVT